MRKKNITSRHTPFQTQEKMTFDPDSKSQHQQQKGRLYLKLSQKCSNTGKNNLISSGLMKSSQAGRLCNPNNHAKIAPKNTHRPRFGGSLFFFVAAA